MLNHTGQKVTRVQYHSSDLHGWAKKVRDCFRQIEAELVCNSRNKIPQTWSPLFSLFESNQIKVQAMVSPSLISNSLYSQFGSKEESEEKKLEVLLLS